MTRSVISYNPIITCISRSKDNDRPDVLARGHASRRLRQRAGGYGGAGRSSADLLVLQVEAQVRIHD